MVVMVLTVPASGDTRYFQLLGSQEQLFIHFVIIVMTRDCILCVSVCVCWGGGVSLFCLLLLFCSIISKWAAVFEIQFQVWQVYSAEQSTQRLQWPVLEMVYVAEVAPVAPLLFAIYLD